MWAEILEGFSVGAIALNEFVFLKSLDGDSYLVGVLFQVSIAIMLFSIFFNQLIRRTSNKKRLFRLSIWITKLPLFMLIFFTPETRGEIFFHYFFIGIYLAYSMTKPLMMPLMNMILKQNYTNKNFGMLYSKVATVNKLVVVISTFLIGSFLDMDGYSFRYLYPITAILSIIGRYIFLRTPFRDNSIDVKLPMGKSLTTSITNMAGIIKKNKPYRDFELGFMFYGFSFMIAWPVMTIFFNDVLEMNYSSVAFYKNQATLMSLLILPFMGKYLSKTDPRKFGIYTFLSLMFFLIFIAVTEYWRSSFELFNITFYYSILIAYSFLAIFFAMMLLLWNIGSVYFCDNDDVSTYQSIHMSMTGVRGLIGPLIGVGVYKSIGYFNTFMLSTIFIILSVAVMYYSMKKYPDHKLIK